MPLLDFLALNVYVASLPLMVAFNMGKALKGGGSEDGHDGDGWYCERVHLAEEDQGYIYSSEESEGKRT